MTNVLLQFQSCIVQPGLSGEQLVFVFDPLLSLLSTHNSSSAQCRCVNCDSEWRIQEKLYRCCGLCVWRPISEGGATGCYFWSVITMVSIIGRQQDLPLIRIHSSNSIHSAISYNKLQKFTILLPCNSSCNELMTHLECVTLNSLKRCNGQRQPNENVNVMSFMLTERDLIYQQQWPLYAHWP